MIQRNKNNSIIFLTTLSVYLGLVLVGAPATVLAQAALADKIEVKDKIGKKDDLDKKRDESDSLQEIYTEKVFADFVKNLQDLQKNQNYDLVEKKDFCAERLWILLEPNRFYPRETPNTKLSSLDKVLAKLIESLDTNGLRNLAAFSKDVLYPNFVICAKRIEPKPEDIKLGSYPNALSLGIYTDVSGVKLKIYLATDSEQKASLLADRLNAEFLLRVNKTEDNFAKQIYENTKVSSSNNQVFIVTRLPRGSLDELLKQNAKAENQ